MGMTFLGTARNSPKGKNYVHYVEKPPRGIPDHREAGTML
jgi:hypothetical protein